MKTETFSKNGGKKHGNSKETGNQRNSSKKDGS